jgi:hypothetical protein
MNGPYGLSGVSRCKGKGWLEVQIKDCLSDSGVKSMGICGFGY